MMMRIGLISPKGPLYRRRGGIFGRALRYAPLTLPMLAALVPEDIEADIRIYDEGVEDLPADLDIDLAALTVITGNARRAWEVADALRARGITVVVGGPHVTLLPEDAEPHADAVVTGYAEQTWPQLLRDFAAGRLQQIYRQEPGLELRNLPRPRMDLLRRRSYITHDVFEASRGCVHDCEFCVVPSAWGRRPLQRPVEEVVAELRARRARRAMFLDLNLTADPTWAAELFEALIPLRLNWYGLATTLLARNRSLLDLAARSGCRGLLMGLESLSPDSLADADKCFNSPEDFHELIGQLHRRRIALQGCFVFGLDHDTPEVFLRTARFAVEAGVDLPRFTVATPFPGTPLFHRLEKEGRILTRNWDLYDGQHVVFRPARMTAGRLQQGLVEAWRYAYSATSIYRRLRVTGAPLWVALVSNAGYRIYGDRLARHFNRERSPDRSPTPAGSDPQPQRE